MQLGEVRVVTLTRLPSTREKVDCALNCKDPGGARLICQGSDRDRQLGNPAANRVKGELGKMHFFPEKGEW
jgi:hypothetical protein